MIRFLFFCCLSGVGLSVDVRQSPPEFITNPGQKMKLFCSHDKTDYRVMYWYQRSPGDTAMKLIGYLNYEAVQLEDPYKNNFIISGDLRGDAAKNGSLTIEVIGSEQGAVYYCAASKGRGNREAYFGAGTKLTVLEKEHNITPPKVTVLRPSAKECQDPKDNQRKKTLVCVATGFYPDHVTVSWKINDENVTSGVATDAAALPDGKFYKTTSRLRVSAEDWFKPDNKFTCIVKFFNGTQYQDYKNSVNGVEAEDGKVMTREKYLRIAQNAKLSYGVFIVKSCIYGAFVAFLVWKLQSSAGK